MKSFEFVNNVSDSNFISLKGTTLKCRVNGGGCSNKQGDRKKLRKFTKRGGRNSETPYNDYKAAVKAHTCCYKA